MPGMEKISYKTNKLREGSLRIVYSNTVSKFEDLLVKVKTSRNHPQKIHSSVI